MVDSQACNLDTSVLMNYVYTHLPGDIERDRGSVRLIDTDDWWCVIGGNAEEEFDHLCERRFALYSDLLAWLTEHPEANLYEYDPTARDVNANPQDIDHVRFEVQHAWADEPRRKQLSDLRRCNQAVETFQQRLPVDDIDHVYPAYEHDPLERALDDIDLAHDVAIVVDAVEINKADGIDLLVSLDADLTATEQSRAINARIRDVEGPDQELRVMEPEALGMTN